MEYSAISLLDIPTPDAGFNAALKANRLEAICGRPYIRTQSMERWLRGDSQRTGPTELHRLLKEVHAHPINYVPFNHLLSIGSDRVDLVFCILYILGRGDLLSTFQEKGIVDNHLGIALAELQEHLREIQGGPELAVQFDCLQWSFAPMLMDMTKRELRKQIIVPIHKWSPLKTNDKKQPVQRGGTSRLYFIEVFPEFLSQRIKDHISWSYKDNAPDRLGPRYHLVMKSLLPGSDSYYANEVENLMSHASTKGVVRFLGSFKHKGWPINEADHQLPDSLHSVGYDFTDVSNRTTCHIFFEFGDFDLLDLFEQFHPAHHVEVTGAWKDLFKLASALEEVHELKVTVDGKQDKASAIHGDIKPENIISVQTELKLADLGFSRVLHKLPGQITSAHIDGLTQPYAAPECLQAGVSLPQSIDIWSLGCVFSLAATWTVRAYGGYKDFARLRERAVKNAVDRQEASGQTSALTQGSYFHDGCNVLQEVKDWHTMLRSSLRIGDNITSKVLGIIEKDMLVPDRQRISAKDLVRKLKELEKLDEDQDSGIPPTIQTFFDDLQKDEAVQAQKTGKGEDLATTMAIKSNKHRKINLHRLGYVTTRIPTMPANGFIALLPPPLVPKAMDSSTSMDYAPRPPPSHPSDTIRHDSDYPNVTRDDIPRLRMSGNALDDVFAPSTTGTAGRNRKRRKPARPANAWVARGKLRQAKPSQGPSSPLPLLHSSAPRNPDDRLRDFYDDRDIVFLIDNQASMIPFWEEARWIFKTLLKISRGIDQDGVDVFFTCSDFLKPKEKDQAKMERALVAAFDRKDIAPSLRNGKVTSMTVILEQYFKAYIEKIQSGGRPQQNQTAKKRSRGFSIKRHSIPDPATVRDATLIVLTNGVWPGSHKTEFERIFKDFIHNLRSHNVVVDDKTRPYSVEFVRFGDDEAGQELLEHLDDDLRFEGITDIVDTEEARGGDVYKMMLGSFVYDYDDLDGFVPPDDEENGNMPFSQVTSPISRHTSPPNPPNRPAMQPSPPQQSFQSPTADPKVNASQSTAFPFRPNPQRPSALRAPGASAFASPMAQTLSARAPSHRRRASFQEEEQASAGSNPHHPGYS